MKPWVRQTWTMPSRSSSDFLLHAVQVILHRLFGEAKAIGDFLVSEPFGDQRNQLLLAAREAKALVDARGGEASGVVFNVAEQRCAE